VREIAQTQVRYGYRKIRVLLNREGCKVGKKLVYRLYRKEAGHCGTSQASVVGPRSIAEMPISHGVSTSLPTSWQAAGANPSEAANRAEAG
jgi:helix-turn-helix protein